MPTLSEMFIQNADKQNTQQISDAGWELGPKLAQLQQAKQAQKAAIQKQQEDLELAKFEKIGGWFEAHAKMPDGPAKKAFAAKFIPSGIQALGMQEKIHPLNMEMMTSDGKLASGVGAAIRERRITLGDLGNPEILAKKAPELYQLGSQEEIAAVAGDYPKMIEDASQMGQQLTSSEKQAEARIQESQRKQGADISATGPKEVARKIGDLYADYAAGGGREGFNKSIEQLNSAAAELKKNPKLTGNFSQKVPYVNSDGSQSFLNPEAVRVKTQAQAALNSALKQTYGSQFTEKEGIRVLNQIWDDRQPGAVNLSKIMDQVKTLKRDMTAREGEFRKQGFMPASGSPKVEFNGKYVEREELKSLVKKFPNHPSAAAARKALGE